MSSKLTSSTASMCELIKKYADVFTKPGKPVGQNIKRKIKLLGLAKTPPYPRKQNISERELKEIQKCLQQYIEKG